MSVTDEVKERLDIIEVISQYVPLKKAGRNYSGLCPFHTEKTPSFVVFPDSQNWHCFGACATGGDVFSFIMKRENLDFGEALALLAHRAGVELRPRTEQASADEQRLERLRALVADAAIYFHYLLNRAGEAEIARSYLNRRGLLPSTWEAWQLGYSLDSWDALRDRLTGKGYSLGEIAEAGLIIQRDDGSGYYDRFRGRLMIPIRDSQGRTIGFGGRVLQEDPERPQPKYINSPQTPLFDKSEVLYGLDMARKAIRDQNLAVIVEGYMDVLMSHQVGVTNVVAGMGTALTEAQMRLVKRYSGNITLALDPDAAGDHAALRGIDTARQTSDREWEPVVSPTGLMRQESRLKAQVRIATLPAGLDPDEVARDDVERWRQVIADAQPIVDYYLALVRREEDLSSARGKASALERMAPLISEIANPVERTHYLQRLARLIRTDELLVAEQVALLGRQAGRQVKAAAATRSEDGGTPRQAGPAETSKPEARGASTGKLAASAGLEEHILGCLFCRPDLLAQLDAEMIAQQAPPLSHEDFSRAENRAGLVALLAGAPAEASEPEELLANQPEELREYSRDLYERAQRDPSLTDEKLLKDLGDSLLRLRARNLYQQIAQLKFLIQESEESAAHEQLRQYQELMVSYAAQTDRVQKLLDARSMAGALARMAERKTSNMEGGTHER